ncbi:hypothetical protein GJU40_15550 [Bacillus lacus]|uniref:Uncharacterized protein n=1 Tax=Metabacillus lacus TaxID=1983721 RepID=A0A7X2J1J2_9BACI|nr:hypothetical protein [Metabacillus lacus]
MKIRKANITASDRIIEQVFIYENKKEEFTLVAVPQLEFSTIIPYEEEAGVLHERLLSALIVKTDPQPAQQLSSKICQWVKEM